MVMRAEILESLESDDVLRYVDAGEEVEVAGLPEKDHDGDLCVAVAPAGVIVEETLLTSLKLPLVISHCWLAKDHPDDMGSNLREIVQVLRQPWSPRVVRNL